MKRLIFILFISCVIFPVNSYSQERNDEARKKLSISLEGQSEKLSSVNGWSQMENKDGKFWQHSESNAKKSYLPCCVDGGFEYLQTFKFSLEGETFYLFVIKYEEGYFRTFAFKSSSLKKLLDIINAADGQAYNSPLIEFCQYYSASENDHFNIETAIQNKEMIRLLLTGQGSFLLSNSCKGSNIFGVNSQVLKGDSIVRFVTLPWKESSNVTIYTTSNYFEVKKSDFIKLFKFTPYLSESGSAKLGSEKMDAGDYQGALKAFDACIKINPNYFNYFTSRGRAKAGLKQYDLAISDYTTALEMIDMGNNSEDASSIYYHRASAKFEKNDSVGAKNDLTNAIKFAKESDKIYLENYLGDFLFQQKIYIDALCYYSLAISRSGSESDDKIRINSLLQRAKVFFNILTSNEIDKEKVQEIYSSRCKELKLYVLVPELLFGRPGVIRDCDEVIELDPNNAVGYTYRGMAKIGTNQKESGCADLKKAKELGNLAAENLLQKYCK